MQRRILRRSLPHLLVPLLLALVFGAAAVEAKPGKRSTYTNPLPLSIPGDGLVESCADPTVIYGQENENEWFMYCTTDPLNDEDRNAAGDFNFHLIPMFHSTDLVSWTYAGDAFTDRPEYAVGNAGLWAPEIVYYPETKMYHLYYTVTETTSDGGGSAIGVAISDRPLGPWTHAKTPVVEPHAADCCPGSRRWVFDPEVLRTKDGLDYLYYGSYFGGVSVRVLGETGFSTDPTTQKNVAVANKFEGPEVVFKDGFYYLFVSATDCCRGPLTGYSVFVGCSTSPTGPFLDREGVDLNDNETPDDPTDARVGGTPVLTMNGNRWVGTGHNTVFQDFDGQWWTIYHAVDQNDPYFEGAIGFTKRPVLLDPVDWLVGWPTVRGGAGASDKPEQGPAAQPGDKTNYKAKPIKLDTPGKLIFGDEFNGTAFTAPWQWVREPAAGSYGLNGQELRFDTQSADLFVDSNNASVLTLDAPNGNYIVETRVHLDVPPEGCCPNYTQAGLVIYGDDNNFVKLVEASIFNTRQTEFAKEVAPVPDGYPRYGNTVVGPPGEWTYLRIVHRTQAGQEAYTAYTSHNGEIWTRGGTWTHELGEDARIGLVAMGRPTNEAFTALFDYVRVYKVRKE